LGGRTTAGAFENLAGDGVTAVASAGFAVAGAALRTTRCGGDAVLDWTPAVGEGCATLDGCAEWLQAANQSEHAATAAALKT
jgi:hypothetical protein